MRYATSAALDAAVTDRIRNVAETSPYGVAELRRLHGAKVTGYTNLIHNLDKFYNFG